MSYYPSSSDGVVQNLLLLAIYLAVILAPAAAIIRRRFRNPTEPDTPLLLGFYTDGTGILPLSRGTLHGMRYQAIATLNKQPTASGLGSQAAYILAIDLPFRTRIHLIGIPVQFNQGKINPGMGKGLLERVSLEGDYDSYFHVYTEKDSQVEARYVLDPKAMAFTVDFCKSYYWEIIKDTLYLVMTNASDPNDPTSIDEDVGRFVDEIRPKIEDKNTPVQEAQRTAYGEDYRTDLKCPICHQQLVNKQTHMACPQNDGVLLQGGSLKKLRDGTLTITMPSKPTNKRPDHIICPACGSPMQHVPYDGSKLTIDTCNSCIYRWLDAGELIKPIDNPN